MKLNTRIKLPDGRIGTICYNFLDGCGGVWGEHTFTMPYDGFGDELPFPDFMLRPANMRGRSEALQAECVGEEYEVIYTPPNPVTTAKVQA
jgi:hypothetical protein